MHMDGEAGPFQVFPGSPNQQFEAAERVGGAVVSPQRKQSVAS
jgi:hypothetical protein